MTIEKFVSPFIPQQFPSFYREEGPNFIAFVKAYYEWLESTDEALFHARSLLEYTDIDTTEAQFIKYFKNTYLHSLPESIITDKRLLVKHILDLYRSKGTPRAYELLFRLIFNESIELYIPGDYLFSPSEGEWVVPRYIETTGNPNLVRLIGKKIYNSSNTATAVVENVTQKIVDQRVINVLYLSSINGRFKYGEKILCDTAVNENNVPLIKLLPESYVLSCNTVSGNSVLTTTANISAVDVGMFVSGNNIPDGTRVSSTTLGTPNLITLSANTTGTGKSPTVFTEVFNEPPVITGSLTAVAIENGGSGFQVGNIIDIEGSGTNGKARVAAIRNEEGKVDFTLVNGGAGYTLANSVVTVLTTKILNITQDPAANAFTSNTKIVSSNTNSNGTIVFANTTFVRMVNFSTDIDFYIGDTVSSPNNGATGTVTGVVGGTGTGATFSIGGITNKATVTTYLDFINTVTGSANSIGEYPDAKYIETELRINTGVQTAAFTVGHTAQSTANVLILDGFYLTSNTAAANEKFSNSTLGVANLYIVKADKKLVLVTGSEADLDSANVVAGNEFISNGTSSVFRIRNTPSKMTIFSNGTITATNSSSVTVSVTPSTNGSPYYIAGAKIVNANNTSANATITSQVRLTDWEFQARPSPQITNLDTVIEDAIRTQVFEIGTISFITNINPGSGYTSSPYVSIIEPSISQLNEPDGFGGFLGRNAVVDTEVGSATGVVTAVEVVDSGFGFVPNETVLMSVESNPNVVVTGSAVVDTDGKGTGNWRTNKSFISDIIKVQDSDYYQKYSYEIIVSKMKDTYEGLVNDLIHPSGMKMFGRFQLHDYQLLETGVLIGNSNIANTTGGIISQS